MIPAPGKDWRHMNGGYSLRADDIRLLDGRKATNVRNLCTGHCGLLAYQRRSHLADSALSDGTKSGQKPSPILDKCPPLDSQEIPELVSGSRPQQLAVKVGRCPGADHHFYGIRRAEDLAGQQ